MTVIEMCVDCRVGSTLVGGISVIVQQICIVFPQNTRSYCCGTNFDLRDILPEFRSCSPALNRGTPPFPTSLCLSRSSKKSITQRIYGQNTTMEGRTSGSLEECSVQLGMIKYLKH